MARDREGDAGMDRLLRAVLADGPARAAGDCPPADDLAAYAERALTDEEREAVEGHLAACGRCQDALALLATMPETAPSTPGASAAGSWWRAGGWKRWLVPVSAAACGLVLYVAIRPDATLHPDVTPETSIVATAPAQPPEQPRAAAAETAPPVPAEAPPPARRRPAAAASPRPLEPVPPLGVQARKSVAADDLTALKAVPEPVSERASAPALIGQDAARPPGTALVRAPLPTPLPLPPPPPEPPAETRAQTGQAASGKSITGHVIVQGEQPRLELQATSATVTPALVRATGSPDVVWRLGPGARISGSPDGGQTWRLQHAGPGEIIAGASPFRTVCWAVGAAGLVLLTTDGEEWDTRPFPERVDLVAVTATGARDATVTTRTGQRFATEDGGATWTPVAATRPSAP